jgi:DNA repair protein Rad10
MTSSAAVPQLPPSFLHVHEIQKGNPILDYIKNVKWAFSKEIVPDYVMNTTCALFLSVKFHFRHPKVSLSLIYSK